MSKYIIALALLALTAACGQDPDPIHHVPNNPGIPNIPGAPTPPIPPGTIDPGTGQPVCKEFKSTWYTLSVPENTLMGVSVGSGVYALTLTSMNSGGIIASFLNDSTHSCMYSATVASDHYTLNNFQGCNPGVIPPGGTVNDQCNYCPSVAPSSVALNIEYDFSLNCTSLTVTDKNTAKSVTYY